MKVSLTGFQVERASPVPEIHQALRAVPVDRPHLLGYTAVARVNPYQALLYRSFGEGGVAVAPVLRGHDFRSLTHFKRLTRSHAIHFHWLSWVLGTIADPDDAARKVQGFLGRVDRFRDRGGKVVWTVHNIYPHDARHVDLEVALQQGVADRADVVHVMADATTRAMRGLLTIDPDKVLTAPHPSYVGAYEDVVARSDARAALGIDADETVFVLFGALKAYKGLHELLDAFHLLCRRAPDRRYRLLVAGHPDDHPLVRDFVERCIIDPCVSIEPRRVSADKAQYYLRAADAGLVTYTRSLNSGAALLYLSFGLPVLATDTPVFREALPAQALTTVANPAESDVGELADGLRRVAEQAAGISGAEVLRLLEPLRSDRVSAAFRDDLGARLRW